MSVTPPAAASLHSMPLQEERAFLCATRSAEHESHKQGSPLFMPGMTFVRVGSTYTRVEQVVAAYYGGRRAKSRSGTGTASKKATSSMGGGVGERSPSTSGEDGEDGALDADELDLLRKHGLPSSHSGKRAAGAHATALVKNAAKRPNVLHL